MRDRSLPVGIPEFPIKVSDSLAPIRDIENIKETGVLWSVRK